MQHVLQSLLECKQNEKERDFHAPAFRVFEIIDDIRYLHSRNSIRNISQLFFLLVLQKTRDIRQS